MLGFNNNIWTSISPQSPRSLLHSYRYPIESRVNYSQRHTQLGCYPSFFNATEHSPLMTTIAANWTCKRLPFLPRFYDDSEGGVVIPLCLFSFKLSTLLALRTFLRSFLFDTPACLSYWRTKLLPAMPCFDFSSRPPFIAIYLANIALNFYVLLEVCHWGCCTYNSDVL